MEKHTYKSDFWSPFPAMGIYSDRDIWELHVIWLRKELVLTFKKKKE